MKMEKETNSRTPVSFWNFLIIFRLQDHMEFSFGYLKPKPKNLKTQKIVKDLNLVGGMVESLFGFYC